MKEALALLETQTYVQRNGNTYEYLTNEEQVIEEEIKNVDIDASEVSSRLFKILSGEVIKTGKPRYSKNAQDFAFGYKLDDHVYGQQRELAVHFITPEYPYGPEETRMHSAGKDELRFILEPDVRDFAYDDFERTPELMAIGEQAMRAALPALKAKLGIDDKKAHSAKRTAAKPSGMPAPAWGAGMAHGSGALNKL